MELHKEKGVNPRMTFCPRCGGESEEIILIGNKDYKGFCGRCFVTSFGSKKCLKCFNELIDIKQIGEFEKLPAREPCDECKTEMKEHVDIVKAGGLYWKCDICNSEGVIKKNEFTDEVRKKNNKPPPNLLGVILTPKQCPICSKTKEA